MSARTIYLSDETGADTAQHIAVLTPAGPERDQVILASEGEDTRSRWYWVRLQNGDLMLATFPCGALYEQVSEGLRI